MTHCFPSDICFLCLSRDRKIFCLSPNYHNLFDFLTECYPQTDARVCWQCRATLEKLRRFKEQAKQAVCALERARIGLQPVSFECLSKMYSAQTLVIDLSVYDDVIATNHCSVDINQKEICKAYKVDVKFEDQDPKIKDEITEEADLGVDAICEKTPDHITKNDNVVGSKCLVTNELAKDRTEKTLKCGTKRFNLPLKIQILAPSSSVRQKITWKNVENCSAIKNPQDVKSKIKCKKPTHRPVRRKFTDAEKLINKERHAEVQKYRLYQRGKEYECHHCGKKFKRRPQILIHMRIHFKKLMCDKCAYRGPDQWTLNKHMLAHVDPSHRPHECEVCHKRFIDKYKLLIHTRSHTGERPFKCDNCDKTFICKEALTFHIKERHTSTGSLVKKRFSQPKTKSSRMSYIYNTSNARSDDRVISRCNRKYKVIKQHENITYECNVCKEIFEIVNTFYKHYHSAHKKEIPCAECNKTFKWKSQLSHHVNIAHKGEKPYQCNICGARCTTKSVLRIHMSSHSNEKPFKCEKCPVNFKYQSALYTHKLIHKGEKPHQCDICNAKFILKSNLLRHLKVHTKDSSFECDICNKKIAWKSNLKNHLKTHLKE